MPLAEVVLFKICQKKQTKISISYFYTKVKSNNFAKNNIELLA